MKAAEWIDRVKATRGWDSDYRVAKELDLSRQAISTYRSKPNTTLDDETAERVAVALDLEPHILVLDQVAERTKSPAVKSGLARMLERIGGGGQVDITSVTQATMAGGDPDSSTPKIRIVSSTPSAKRASPVGWPALAAALRSFVSYGPSLSPA